jgi:death-on-curing family protein
MQSFGESLPEIQYLSVEDICEINKAAIRMYGGFVDRAGILRINNSLDYLVDAVRCSVFGKTLYPRIPDKASFYLYHIIRSQPFYDGNKRTGMLTCRVFLLVNEWDYQPKLTTEERKHIAFSIATNNMKYDEVRRWMYERVRV